MNILSSPTSSTAVESETPSSILTKHLSNDSGASKIKYADLSSPPSTLSNGSSSARKPKLAKQPPKRFLSRLMRKKSSASRDDDDDDDEIDGVKDRDEGCNANVVGYVPNVPTAPKYIWVKSHRKKNREFNRMFLAQELKSHMDFNNSSKLSLNYETNKRTIWCTQFSKDGKYLATAGADKVIRIWQVISKPEEREVINSDLSNEEDKDFCGHISRRSSVRRSKPKVYYSVFLPFPVKEFRGHTADILDLSWSKNSFLLSSSMDKTVKLWHIKKKDVIASFEHPDFVTSIAFHPEDDRFFLSGSLDRNLRLWSITEKKVSYSATAPDLVMDVVFTPDGEIAIAGCFGGQCLFYETKGLILKNQMVVKSAHGKNSNGSKITGIEVMSITPRFRKSLDPRDTYKLLISTNDSRVRLYNFSDKTIQCKFKGHENTEGLIKASFSSFGNYVISGSEDERTYIWNIDNQGDNSKTREDYEYFHSNSSVVTCALFVPDSARKILYESRDPIYDIADPPPVILQRPSMSEMTEVQAPPTNYKVNPKDGNIIVTTDQNGIIKVFRQDSAYERRKLLIDNANQISKKKISGLSLSPTTSSGGASALSVKMLRGISPIGRPRKRSDVSGSYVDGYRSPSLAPYNNKDELSRTHSHSSLSSWASSKHYSSSTSNLHNFPKFQSHEMQSSMTSPEVEHDDDVECRKCGGHDFKARASRTTGSIVLMCAE